MIPIIDSKRQYATIQEQAEKEVIEVMRSGQYILGKHNKALEEEMANYVGTKYSVCLNSGTDALHLALRALDIGQGDEVITVAFTFVATTEAIGIVGAVPVFVDIDENTIEITFSSTQYMKILEWILQQGCNAKPLEPKELVDEWKSQVTQMFKMI